MSFENIVRRNICGDGYDANERAEMIIEAHNEEFKAYKEKADKEVKTYKEKAEKYRWHDLRKNPNDLPPNEHEVDIAYERYNSTYTARAIYEDGTVHSEDSSYVFDEIDEWCEYCYDTDDYIIPRGWIEVTKFAENMGLVDIRVIAWREVEPFEE